MSSATSPVTPRLSSAVMLLRPGDDGALEVYMVRRHIQSDFAPDVYVFPGGSVTDGDREAEVTAGVCVPIDALTPETALGTGVRVAAIRELFEEAGVLIATPDEEAPHGLPDASFLSEYRARLQRDEMTMTELAAAEEIVIATDVLTHSAHWITPETFPKRFDTHFFLTLLPAEQEATHDEHETTDGVWVRPAEALTKFEAGNFPLVFATVHQLRDLAQHTTPTDAIAAWRGRIPPVIMPRVVMRGETQHILMPGESDPD